MFADFADGVVLADDAGETVARGVFFAEQEIFAQEFLLLRRAFHEQFQVIEIDRFLDEIEGSVFHCGDGFFDGTVGCKQNHRDRRIDSFGRSQDVESRRTRQLQIGEDREVAAGAQFLDGGGAVGGFVDGVASALEGLAQHGAELVFVFDQEQGFHVPRFSHGKQRGFEASRRDVR